LDGFLCVDKPCGPSSFTVVKTVRRELLCSKAGHAGTLDTAASGLIIVALGAATRLLSYLPEEPKRYCFGMRFGRQTDTLDSEGKITAEGGRVPARSEIESLLPRFVGEIRQAPPKFSAVKVGGRRAYSLARGNEEFDLKEKTVRVSSLSLTGFDPETGIAECDMTCSRGTYVRALVRDVAAGLGTVAYASSIRRLAIGPFSVDNAVPFDNIGPESAQRIIPVRDALASVPSAKVNQEQCGILAHGKDVRLDEAAGGEATGDIVIAYAENGDVAAVLTRAENGMYHPVKVFVKG
jgi:tRNA pseudouridine55 synthase